MLAKQPVQHMSANDDSEASMISKLKVTSILVIKIYSKMLAKRLVQHMSASDDAEASMISKLKVIPS